MTRRAGTEIETMLIMLTMYCRSRHGRKGLCASCLELYDYTAQRLRNCPRTPKPECKKCPSHCFSPEMHARVREVMRYAGPRMPLRHPFLTLRHYLGI